MNQVRYNAATGCLLGALVGDAAGATLEFLRHDPTSEDVDHAMSMPGGGRLKVASGQITDDGELTLCLARALAGCDTFEIERIALSYAEWIKSDPFDIGLTTASSLGAFRSGVGKDGYAAVMRRSAARMCINSKANGSLMRITPLGIWGYNLEIAEIANYARQDSALSHPNPSCGYAVACYCIAIATLIKQPRKRDLAFDNAQTWLNSQESFARENRQYSNWQEVSSWLNDAEYDRNIPCTPKIGFVKIAFTHAFRHLLLGSDYESAIAETLSGGGDTDTNACIVGGLIGAAVRVDKIPQKTRDAVLNCDTSLGKHPRPDFLHPRQVKELIPQLLKE